MKKRLEEEGIEGGFYGISEYLKGLVNDEQIISEAFAHISKLAEKKVFFHFSYLINKLDKLVIIINSNR